MSGKYATYPSRQIKTVKTRLLTLKEITNELMFGEWASQTPNNIEQEIENSMIRNSIEPSTFKIAFMKRLSEQVEEELERFRKEHLYVEPIYQQVHLGKQDLYYYDCRLIIEFYLS